MVATPTDDAPDEAPTAAEATPVADADDRPASAEGADAPAPTIAALLGPRRLRLIGVVAAVVLVADQLTKTWALRALQDGPIDVVWTLRFNLVYNTGVAFSQGSDQGLGPWISLLAFGVVIAISLGATSRTPLGAAASGLIAGGAVGNLADRAFRGDDGFLHGAVVDFIDLQWWPVWNIADAGVVVGAILLVVASLRIPEPS